MPGSRQEQRISAWVAIFAILLAALAPAVSSALASMHCPDTRVAAQWCSAKAGMPADLAQAHSHHADDSDDSHHADMHGHAPATGDHELHFEHCPFCFIHAGSFATLPVPEFIFPLTSAAALAPQLFLHAPRPLFVWAAPQARAPPSSC